MRSFAVFTSEVTGSVPDALNFTTVDVEFMLLGVLITTSPPFISSVSISLFGWLSTRLPASVFLTVLAVIGPLKRLILVPSTLSSRFPVPENRAGKFIIATDSARAANLLFLFKIILIEPIKT